MKFPLVSRIVCGALIVFLFLAVGCSDSQFNLEPLSSGDQTLYANTATAMTVSDCSSCTYVVPAGQTVVDGAALGLKPGSVIGLNGSSSYGHLIFRNIVGSPENPITIRNCGGTAEVDATGMPNGIKMEHSKYFRITGGEADKFYGIRIIGGHMGVSLGNLSTNFEVDHLEILNSGFAGIIAKTDPTCDDATIRANFLMEDVAIHHNYIHDTGGEGIYAGNSWFSGMERSCGLRLPHEIHNIVISHNIVHNTGWDAIQLGCATEGASIHDNVIENYGTVNKPSQSSGIQLSSGTGGLCYNNLIRKGTGNGMAVMGLGDNIIFNNIIDQAGSYGIFCDERASTGPGFQFLNNTIISPKLDGIRIYAEQLAMNVIVNNVIANPGNYLLYSYPRSSEDAFVYRLSDDVNVEMSGNYFTTDVAALHLADLALGDYRIQSGSGAIDKGTDVTRYHNILTDFYGGARVTGASIDAGATEFSSGAVPVPAPANVLPVVSAGSDKSITLPQNTIYLEGKATDSDGSIVSYEWTKVSGGTATLQGITTPGLQVGDMEAGTYEFRLTVTDDAGDAQSDDVAVTVHSTGNLAPVANAGPNRTVALPVVAVKLYGSGTDKDGTIESYRWTQYGGPTAVITNATSATASVSGLVAGSYYFKLTVEDNNGETHSDNMLLKVESNEAPVADAGGNVVLTAPTSTATLRGSGTDSDGSIVSYSWTQYRGAPAFITGATSATATVSGLTVGSYYFRLTVTDDDGASHYDNMLVRVEESGTVSVEPSETDLQANIVPEVSAGPNQVLTVPTSATQLMGSAVDPDGTIESVVWTQYGGEDVSLNNADGLTASISGLEEGKYYFELTVTDNDGAQNSDRILVRVLPST